MSTKAAVAAPAAGGVLAAYPVSLSADRSKRRFIDLFNAQKALLMTQREATGEKASRAAPAAADAGTDPIQQAQLERAEVSRHLAKTYTYTPMHVPGGAIMQKVATLTFISPNGFRTITREYVEATLKESGRRYITDLLEGSSVDPSAAAADEADSTDAAAADEQAGGKVMKVDAVDVFRGYSYKELDEMRFALVAVAELASKQVFEEDGRLTGLAKRDMRRHADEAAKKKAAAEEAATAATAPAAAAAGAGSAAAGGDKPQKNLKPLLLDQCMTRWPHTPPDKAAVFTMEQDPNQPRHKPLFRAVVNLTLAKRIVTGSWMPTKRDADNAAAEAALAALVQHFRGK